MQELSSLGGNESQCGLYQSIFENCQFGLIVLDASQNILAWNPWVSKHSGLDFQSQKGKSFTSVFPAIIGSSLERAVSVAISHGMSSVISHTLNQNPLPLFFYDGQIMDQQFKVLPLLEAGDQRLCLVQISDISAAVKRDRQLLEHVKQTLAMSQSLAQEKERAQVTLDSIADAVITTDAKGCVLSMNPSAEQLIGMRESDLNLAICDDIFRLIDENGESVTQSPIFECLNKLDTIVNKKDHILLSMSGDAYPITYSVAPIKNTDGTVLGAVLVFSDETKSRRLSAELNWQALHDPLTGLVNRRAFEIRTKELLENARHQEYKHFLFYLDLDQFKVVNDTCGHDAGDELLKQIAVLFQQRLRKTDMLARLGGDEFGVLLESCEQQSALKIAESMLKAVEDFRFAWHNQLFKIGVSIGITMMTGNETKSAEILSAADSACYAAKENGRNQYHFHESDETGASPHQQEMQWISKIQHALDNNGLVLYVQRIQDLRQLSIPTQHYEVLVRMYDAEKKLIPPGAFLPAAERFNLMGSIDRWVISSIFNKLKASRGNIPMFSINVSGVSISDDSLLAYIIEELDANPQLATSLCFELTETAAIANMSKAMHFLTRVRERGCRISLDDFGSGLSSFAYLKRMPIDAIKIDGYFVKGISEDPINLTFVETIKQIGRAMGLSTIAEFVENDSVIAKLSDIGVDYAQGYGIHVPCPMDQIF